MLFPVTFKICQYDQVWGCVTFTPQLFELEPDVDLKLQSKKKGKLDQ